MDEATNVGAKPEQPAFHEFGSVPFSGRPDALFERHLLADAVVEPSGAYDRQCFEALARSARDLLSRRCKKATPNGAAVSTAKSSVRVVAGSATSLTCWFEPPRRRKPEPASPWRQIGLTP